MGDVVSFLQDYEIGQEVLTEMAKMNRTEFLSKLTSVISGLVPEGILTEGSVTKTYVNDVISKIEVHYYDSIEISWLGIYYKPEHGPYSQIIKFNSHFNL